MMPGQFAANAFPARAFPDRQWLAYGLGGHDIIDTMTFGLSRGTMTFGLSRGTMTFGG